jgi:hypothetical protein
MAVVRPDDGLFIGLAEQGGVAVSVVRDGFLVTAAGAVSAVPLGRDSQSVKQCAIFQSSGVKSACS